MGHRKGITLRALLARYLVTTGALVLLITLIWWTGLMSLMGAGFVLPANTAEQAAYAAAERMRQTGAMDDAARSSLFDYILLDADGAIVETSLAGRALARARARVARGEAPGKYMMRVPLADGGACVLSFDFAVPYRDEALRGRLPDFQASALVVLMAGLIACMLVTTLRFSGRLKRQIDLLSGVAGQIAGQNLDFEMPRAGIQEIGDVLSAMEALKAALRDSLHRQWMMEQQRQEQMQSLVHDLRTPLTVVEGNAELLAEDAALNAEQRRYAEAIIQSAGNAQACVKALRGALLDEGARPQLQMTELRSWAEGFLEAARALCAGQGVLFALQAEPVTARIDPQEMQRAVMNLIDNAARFTPAGGSVTLSIAEKDSGIALTVADTGPGFTQEALLHGRERFYRGERARGQDGHYGLGLYGAAQTAARHGGDLALQNGAQGGAQATIALPKL